MIDDKSIQLSGLPDTTVDCQQVPNNIKGTKPGEI